MILYCILVAVWDDSNWMSKFVIVVDPIDPLIEIVRNKSSPYGLNL